MARHRKRPWPRTLGQGRTRRWRIGSQDIPGPVASQQSLPPLLLTMAFDQEAVSRCNRWTSEPCLEKSHRFTAIPPNSALNRKTGAGSRLRSTDYPKSNARVPPSGPSEEFLHHVINQNSIEENVKLIGIYSSESEGRLAIKRLKDKPGFSDLRGQFQLEAYALDMDHWVEGFGPAEP